MKDKNYSVNNFFEKFVPAGVSYFAMPVFESFAGKPMHSASFYGEWDKEAMVKDYSEQIYRSNLVCAEGEEEEVSEWMRLLIRLDEDLWALVSMVDGSERLTVYSSDRTTAAKTLKAFREKYQVADEFCAQNEDE